MAKIHLFRGEWKEALPIYQQLASTLPQLHAKGEEEAISPEEYYVHQIIGCVIEAAEIFGTNEMIKRAISMIDELFISKCFIEEKPPKILSQAIKL